MKRIILSCAAVAAAFSLSPSFALGDHQEIGPRETVDALFDAMRAGDKEALLALWAEGGDLGRVTSDGRLRGNSLQGWAEWVGTLSPGQADEQIFDVKVQEFGNLATVWAPFKIYIDGDLKGCGVNTFTLAKREEGWRIVHGMDTDHPGDCMAFGPGGV